MTREEITAKLRKLLAIASNTPDENEAANAFARAQELASKYRIELAEVSVQTGETSADEEMTEGSIGIDGKRIMGWKKNLISAVCKANGVFVVISQDRNFTLAGRQMDVRTSIYLFEAVSKEIERLGALQYGKGRSWVNAYKLGAAVRVGDRILEQAKQDIEAARNAGVSSAALVKIEQSNALARRWWENQQKEPVRLRSSKSSYRGQTAYEAGQAAGSRINIGGNTALAAGKKMIQA